MSDKKESSAMDSSASGKSSIVFHESYEPRPMSSSPSQPFFFQQYTVRELVTPTKQGNIAIKAVSSISLSNGDKWPQALYKSFSSAFNLLPAEITPNQNLDKNLLSLPQHPYWTSSEKSQSKTGKPAIITNGHSEKANMRSRPRVAPPSKKVKVDSFHGDPQKTKSNYKGSRMQRHNKKDKEVEKLHWKYILVISLLPLLVVMGAMNFTWPVSINYDENSIQHKWNLKLLNDTLSQSVFGQDAAITSLLNILDNFLNKDMAKEKEMPVILISGSSGVGKSLISSIVLNTFPPPGKTELVLPPTPPPEHILRKFSETWLNLIVVDSLNPHFISDTIKWTQNLFSEAIWQNKQIVVILVHNVQEWNGDTADYMPLNLRAKGEALFVKLVSSGLDSHHIHLEPLTEEHVNNCIRVALEKRGLHNAHCMEVNVEHISKSINYRQEGCKSVWSRAATVDC